MTVRWKPLLILSGVFLAIFAIALLAFNVSSSSPSKLLALAESERDAGKLEIAKIHYQRAAQADPTNPKVHLGLASLYERMREGATGQRREDLNAEWRQALAAAAKHGRDLAEPRVKLLRHALERGDMAEAFASARELIAIDPDNADAAYALGLEAADKGGDQLSKAVRHLAALEEDAPRRPRVDWLAFNIADKSERAAEAKREVLDRVRSNPYPAPAELDPVDRIALMKLRTMELASNDAWTPETLTRDALAANAAVALAAEIEGLSATQINQLVIGVQTIQGRLLYEGARDPESKPKYERLAEAAEEPLLALFRRETENPSNPTPDLRVMQLLAAHHLNRGRNAECLATVARALDLPQVANPGLSRVVLSLKNLGIQAALADTSDPARFDRVAKYIKELIDANEPAFRGMGHLYQGAIDLERSGLASGGEARGETERAESSRRLAEAIEHLGQAASALKDNPNAQALYGIALLLNRELDMGRQQLFRAYGLGSLQTRYQLWAAWSLIQAGYPEEAEPIANALLAAIEAKRVDPSMRGAVLMLQAEIAQARRTPENYERALAKYDEAIAAGVEESASLSLRRAQLLMLLKRNDEGLAILKRLRDEKKGGAEAENLAVLALIEMDKRDAARAVLAAARKVYPDDVELLLLDSRMLVVDGEPEKAEALLAEYCDRRPEVVQAHLARAQLLATQLDRPDRAREILNAAAERGNHSAPLVQLALLALSERDFDGVNDALARLRKRQPESSAADLIQSQIELANGNAEAASELLAEAIRKDPSNKVAVYFKARLDMLNGEVEQSSQQLLSLAREDVSKEVEPGVSVSEAAEFSLVSLATRNGDFDEAINRIRDMLQAGDAKALERQARWRLVDLHIRKSEFDQARAEIDALLKSAPPEILGSERVRAADHLRRTGDFDEALAEIDRALEAKPDYAGALGMKAVILYEKGDSESAKALMAKSIAEIPSPPPTWHLILAALENETGDDGTRGDRAIQALDQGIERFPDYRGLVEAKIQLLSSGEDRDAAVKFLERLVAEPKGAIYRGLLVQAYRVQGRFDRADELATAIASENPENPGPQLMRIQIAAARAAAAAAEGRADEERAASRAAWERIAEARERFPRQIKFVEAAAELAAREGDVAKALEFTREIDAMSRTAVSGALTRARIALSLGRARDAVDALNLVLERDPTRVDARVSLAGLLLDLGEPNRAMTHVDWMLSRLPDNPRALVLKARALTFPVATPARNAERRAEALAILEKVAAESPEIAEAALRVAEIRMMENRRDLAVAALEKSLEANPRDTAVLSALIRLIAENRPDGSAPEASEVERAEAIARARVVDDPSGRLALAVALGFSRGGRIDSALPWAEKAVEADPRNLLGLLGLAGLYLAKGEAAGESAEARPLFERAAEIYGKALALNPNSIEAANNKAWVHLTHLGDPRAAMETLEGLLKRFGDRELPPEFHDTVGSVLEALGDVRGAEARYNVGLTIAPDEPVLNFHMGRLLASIPERASLAESYLRKSEARAEALKPSMREELADLLRSRTR